MTAAEKLRAERRMAPARRRGYARRIMLSVGPRQRMRLNTSAYQIKARPFSRICVAVDGSDAAQRAARLAIALVHDDAHAEIVFCHVINLPQLIARAEQSFDDYAKVLDAARAEARSLLERCLEHARAANVVARSIVRYGAPAPEVLDYAESIGADLVVIGNRPTAKLARILNGSVRDELVRTCRVPLLLADGADHADQARAFHPRRVLLARSDALQVGPAKRVAAKLAIEFAAQLVLLPGVHAGIDREKATIDRAVRELRPGLIVMACPQGSRLYNVFAGNIVERVIQDARMPLLIVRETL
jgi:nucleotide-binding universal stress UspA family protein